MEVRLPLLPAFLRLSFPLSSLSFFLFPLFFLPSLFASFLSPSSPYFSSPALSFPSIPFPPLSSSIPSPFLTPYFLFLLSASSPLTSLPSPPPLSFFVNLLMYSTCYCLCFYCVCVVSPKITVIRFCVVVIAVFVLNQLLALMSDNC